MNVVASLERRLQPLLNIVQQSGPLKHILLARIKLIPEDVIVEDAVQHVDGVDADAAWLLPLLVMEELAPKVKRQLLVQLVGELRVHGRFGERIKVLHIFDELICGVRAKTF